MSRLMIRIYHRIIKREVVIFVLLCIGFFWIWTIVPRADPWSVTSPDEAANSAFTRHFVQTTNFTMPAESGPYAFLEAPRSVAHIQNRLVLGSFPGLVIVYGLLGKVTGEWAIPYFSALFSLCALWALFGIFRKHFSSSVALIGTFAFAMHPGFWYNLNRPFHHNVLFVDSLIIGAWFLFRHFDTNRWRDMIGAIFFLSVALLVRTSEITWVVVLLFFALFATRKQHSSRRYAILLSPIIAIIVLMIWNHSMFGSATTTGYTLAPLESRYNEDVLDVGPTESSSSQSVFTLLPRLLVPLPVVWGNIIPVARDYLFVPSFPTAIIALISIMYALKTITLHLYAFVTNKPFDVAKIKKWMLFGFVYLFIVFYLLLVYSSILIEESSSPLLESSYYRYFLPLYVLLSYFICQGVSYLDFFRNQSSRILLITAILIVSTVTLFFNDRGNITELKNTVKKQTLIRKAIVAATENNALILSGRSDKIIFPDRSVVAILPKNQAMLVSSVGTWMQHRQTYLYQANGDNSLNDAIHILGQYYFFKRVNGTVPDGILFQMVLKNEQ